MASRMPFRLNRLYVVPKRIQRGPNGGLYYETASGRRVYLKPSQRSACRRGRLPGAIGPCVTLAAKRGGPRRAGPRRSR